MSSVAVDLPSLLTMAIAGLVAFVFTHFRGEITRLERDRRDGDKTLEHRVTNAESAASSVPALFERVVGEMRDSLKRIELQIAQNHPTKAELAASMEGRNNRLDEIEHELRGVRDVMGQLLARLDVDGIQRAEQPPRYGRNTRQRRH